jgi:hypothetical protein
LITIQVKKEILTSYSDDNFALNKKRNMKQLFFSAFFILVFSGCKKIEKAENEKSFVLKVEQAHQKDLFLDKEVIQFDLKLKFGNQERINGKVTLTTNSSKGKIALADGNTIIFNGSTVYYAPEIDSTSVRFDAYTWSYFFMLPYKLSDSGTVWQSYDTNEKDADKFNTEKLSFKPQTGDAPDDWYVVYSDKNSNLIQKAAYIVTAFGSKNEAEKNPHAIQYTDFKGVKSIPIATSWTFWEWNDKEGLTTQLGEAKLTNIEFIRYDFSLFNPVGNFQISNRNN